MGFNRCVVFEIFTLALPPNINIKNSFSMNKQIYFFVFSLLVFSGVNVFSNSTRSGWTIEEQIELLGDLGTGEARLFQAIQVKKTTDKLEIEFSESLNVISFEIVNETGKIVYEEVFDVNSKSKVNVYLDNWKPGTYNILFTNSAGKYLSGYFELDK
jgi:hypothetical protein